MADLSLVLLGREHVGPAEQLEVGVRAVAPDLVEQILEANHEVRCLMAYRSHRHGPAESRTLHLETIRRRAGSAVWRPPLGGPCSIIGHARVVVAGGLETKLYFPALRLERVLQGLTGGILMRKRSSAAYLALVMGLSVALAGCGYIGQVRAMKAFKDGNKAYGASDWRAAAEKYEEASTARPEQRGHLLLPGQLLRQHVPPGPQGRAGQRRAAEQGHRELQAGEREADGRHRSEALAGPRVPGRRLRPRQARRPDPGRTGGEAHD